MTFHLYPFKNAHMIEVNGVIVAFDTQGEAIDYAVLTAQSANSLYTINYYRPCFLVYKPQTTGYVVGVKNGEMR